ncbi:hypothetical protein LA345_39130 (plasmid) [Burkholderia vietnamiensis]|uniref:Uncharacterized protein n=1 Tax=Burkholderia vietnamiensis (strain G4 / LMG 22486) TaxID=269482 RepID=A4JWI5_BURVG|nr:hypothetical protein Bcep1808_7768 [Burkholderia vietnamiensis G4]MCB4349814.1 hypothetical protein [Burkholderia vietnamiensis]
MLKKSLLVEANGVPASVHRVSSVTVGYVGGNTTAQVESFYNEDSLAKSRAALTSSSITVQGLPAPGQDARDFVESELIKPVPDGVTSSDTLKQYSSDQYVFSGAAVIANPA